MQWHGLLALLLGVACLSKCSGKGTATPYAPGYAAYGPNLVRYSGTLLQDSAEGPENQV